MSDAVHVDRLTVSLGERTLVADVSFSVGEGRILAIVGESGAGKSLAVRALLGLAPGGATVTARAITVAGIAMTDASQRSWRTIRGKHVALVTQDALGALDPLRRVGAEVTEPLVIHRGGRGADLRGAGIEALESAGMPDAAARYAQYPHELSGGLRQRAVIASALITAPEVLVADEPTTALDATVQRRVLLLLRSLADAGQAIVLVSHDLTAVAGIADDIAVMKDGRIIEQGPAAQMLTMPREAYTRELWAAAVRKRPALYEVAGAVLLTVDALSKRFGDRTAVDDVSLELRSASILGIVGESGSGKTTLARILLGVQIPDSGVVTLAETPTSAGAGARGRRVQFVAQDPRAAFNPGWTIARTLREALRAAGVARAELAPQVQKLLQEVDLDPILASRRPSQLSGGQLQRAAIARALAANPDVLILDEPLSALDVSLVGRILALLVRLRDERGIAMAIISHDLAVIGEIADEVIVMSAGAVVERGPTVSVFASPSHALTRELLEAAGRLSA